MATTVDVVLPIWQAEFSSPKQESIFPEVKFIRLAPLWRSNLHRAVLPGGTTSGGRIFKRYDLIDHCDVHMDFEYSGEKLDVQTTGILDRVLGYPHKLTQEEFYGMAAGIGGPGERFGELGLNQFYHRIISADVGPVHGRNVLAIQWIQAEADRSYVSVYFTADDDPAILREIHVSASTRSFDDLLPKFIDTVRSLQWSLCAPPPTHDTYSLTEEELRQLRLASSKMAKEQQLNFSP